LAIVPPLAWHIPGHEWLLGGFPRLMGILNVTPDSFSDGGELLDAAKAVDAGLRLIDEGADILDVGGESTRPGALPVDVEEEARRVLPVVEQLARQTAAPISIDTTKSQVAARALDAGARIVNDISGLTFDASMPEVCRRTEAGIVCMHIQGTPQTMQHDPRYGNVVAEVSAFLSRRLDELAAAGIPRERVVIDPGIGFGKTAEHNLELLRNVDRLRALGRPVLIGHSRKRFLRRILKRELDERAAATLGVSVALALKGVDLLRVHDVRATRDALAACSALLAAAAPPPSPQRKN
jgi:dihydropteroate synthase